ncbi:cytochrome d ubiquinol oxidase subunit II [Phaeacidiphilus oryzae]|uniref:cytochrome d ubiquinol oxidase subunit II n=1 Tax=Phaeacidiphilus oryzae TaxID=348818 RepID=UPI000569CB6D|nr:cytochrome d ubiquinol oxidase subunit II [Phaeacidiphilus oryzae]
MYLHDFWFLLIAVLWTGYFFLEGFDFGVGVLLNLLARGETERRVLINTIGPVWDGNEVWLVTAIGATFAAFPSWYGAMLSGFYLPMLLILVCLILRVVAFEYRAKRDGERWKRGWEQCVFWSSLLTSFVWGAVFADMVHGMRIDRAGDYIGGLGGICTPYAALGGLAFTVLFTFHGAVFTALKTTGEIRLRARGLAMRLGVLALLVVTAFLGVGQAERGDGWSLAALVAAGAALIASLAVNRLGREGWAFLGSGVAVAAVIAALFLSLFPNVMPSTLDPAWSLTTANASSADYTLKVMTWVAVFATPLVILYQGWTYWVFRKRIGIQHIPAATAGH